MNFVLYGKLLANAGKENIVRVWVMKDAALNFSEMRKQYTSTATTSVSHTPSVRSITYSDNDHRYNDTYGTYDDHKNNNTYGAYGGYSTYDTPTYRTTYDDSYNIRHSRDDDTFTETTTINSNIEYTAGGSELLV